MRRLSEINRYDKRRRGAACTRRRRVERDQYLGLRGGLPGHWKAFLQLVSTSVIVDQDYFVLSSRKVVLRPLGSGRNSHAECRHSQEPTFHHPVVRLLACPGNHRRCEPAEGRRTEAAGGAGKSQACGAFRTRW